jgi:hypothetical protein
MSLSWGPSNEELMNAQSHQFSANLDNPPLVDQLVGKDSDDSDESEVEDDEDNFGHLYNLVEAAHLIDSYRTDKDIVPLLEDTTLHEKGSTPNNSPQKRSCL